MHTIAAVLFRFVITSSFFILCIHAFGQRSDLLFHHLELKEGVSELTNEFVYQDLEGFIWIGSISGLNRYDGARVKKYLWDLNDSTSIYGENIQSPFFESDSSGFWFCTYEAINFYDRAADQFRHFFVHDTTGDSLRGCHAFHLDSQDRLWLLAGEKSIFTFDIHTKKITKVASLSHNAQRAVAVTNQSRNVLKVFAYRVNSSGIQEIEFHNGVQKDSVKIILDHLDGNDIYARKILIQDESTFWYVAQSELIRYNFRSGATSIFMVPNILDVIPWTDTTLLVSIDQEGIIAFDKTRMVFLEKYTRDVTDPYSLLSNRIRYMSTVRNGGFWFSSPGVGLSFTYPAKRKFDLINPFSAEENRVFNPILFFPYQGMIYAPIRDDGLYALDGKGKNIKKINGADSRADERLESITRMFVDDQNVLWISTYLGACVLEAPGKPPRAFGSEKNISGIALSEGRIIFSTKDGGLFEIDKFSASGELIKIKPDVFSKVFYQSALDGKDRFWLFDEANSCMVINSATFEIIAELPIKGFSTSFLEVPELHTIWISTSLGLYNIDSKDLKIRTIHNETNGFPITYMSSSLMDAKGRLWITSHADILMFDPKHGTTRLYSIEDGLPKTVFNLFSALRFADDKMWFGSPDGITSFYPDQLTEIITPAIPQITTLQVNDHEASSLQCLASGVKNITEIKRLSFSYKENTLGFIVNALEYSAPSTNKVMYKMENLDPDWVTTTNGALVRYPNIPPGKYTFYVKAFNSDGIANEVLRKLEISIIPPYYKTWWFYTLVVLSGLSLVSLFLYQRIRQALEIQKVRLRLYENLHDDVGSRLTSIVMSADMMLNEEKGTNPKLQQMVSTGRSIISNMKRLVWAIDPVNESMESLILKIRDDRNMTLDPAVHFELESDPALQQKVIPGEIRYQLMSIISEAFHNITKYAQAKNVWVHFSKKDKHLVMSIRDDGIGFDPATVSNDKVKTSGYGLGNMSKRMKRVNGNLDISSSPGHGTTITVNIPLK